MFFVSASALWSLRSRLVPQGRKAAQVAVTGPPQLSINNTNDYIRRLQSQRGWWLVSRKHQQSLRYATQESAVSPTIQGISSANILRMLDCRPLHFIQHAIITLAPYCPTAGMHAKRPSSDAARVRRPREIADKNYQPADYEITDPICCPLDWSSIMPSDSVTMYAFRPGQMDIFRSRTLSYEANYT